ncbi:hypothetical protein EDB85DRAFT_1936097 [Lactarius pseudohatsudake]|nr:hypothetical protein EDB85DRAFT_1936097 [Lactarius pseudohatsudake]
MAVAAGEGTGVARDESDGTVTNSNRGPRRCRRTTASMAQEPAENAPVVTQDGTVEVEEIEGLTPEEVFHSPARCAPASTLNDPCCAPNFCIPDAHDYPVHRTHLPCASLLADRYHPNLHYALRAQVALCLFARIRQGSLAQADGCPARRAGCCGVPDTCRRCCASTSSHGWGGGRRAETMSGAA